MDTVKTGEFLKALRKAKGLTQEEVAEQLFLSPKTVSRWESGAGIPDINIIQSVAEFYGVTVDEILSGERKTFDEETLSYKTQKEKREGRNRLIKENALGKYGVFYIIALGILAVFWALAAIFLIISNRSLFYAFLAIGPLMSAALIFYGTYETHRILSSAGEELADGVTAAKGEILKRNLFFSDVTAVGLFIFLVVSAVVDGGVISAFQNTVENIRAALGVGIYYDYGINTSMDVYYYKHISICAFAVCAAAAYVIIRMHFTKRNLGETRDLINRFVAAAAVLCIYFIVFIESISFVYTYIRYNVGTAEYYFFSLPVWWITLGYADYTAAYIAGVICAGMAAALTIAFAVSRKTPFAFASVAAGIASAMVGYNYIVGGGFSSHSSAGVSENYISLQTADVNPCAIVAAAFVMAICAIIIVMSKKEKSREKEA